MSDSRDDYLRERLAERARREELRREERAPAAAREAGLSEQIDSAVRKIVTSIVIAGGLIAGAAYWSGGGEAPRYQVTAADGRIIRVNTDSGTVIACETANGECAIVLRRGQDLADELPTRALPAPPPAAPKADNAAVPVPAAR